jgi:hypothetical protein
MASGHMNRVKRPDTCDPDDAGRSRDLDDGSSGRGLEAATAAFGRVAQNRRRRSSMLRSDEPHRLGNQCKRMNRRSKTGSYVWIYDERGVISAKAPQSSQPILQRLTGSSSVWLAIGRIWRPSGSALKFLSAIGITIVSPRLSLIADRTLRGDPLR